MLPTTQDYKISLMIGQDSFRTLENVEVIPNPNYPDEPWYATGGLAIVFKLKLKDKLYALKCFYNEASERQERLELVTAYLKQHPSPYFVDFTYLENELWVATDHDEGQGYPVVLMEWVEGKTLDNYLEQLCTQQNIPALRHLYFQFCNLAWWLQQQPIAHGDIKHDNLIVAPDGKLKLIDYDGVFVPAMRGRKANEMGSPCYQHPKRDAYFFDKNLDDFSLLVLQITLLALQHQPKLFEKHYNGDGIILKDTDYQNFTQSSIKTILWQLPEARIPLLLSQLQANLTNLSSIDLMPLLQDVAWINWLIGGQKDDKLEFERQRLLKIIKNEKVIEVFPFLISHGLKSFDPFFKNTEDNPYITFNTIDSEYRINIDKKYHRHIRTNAKISNNFCRWRMQDTRDINSFEISFKFDENWKILVLETVNQYFSIPKILINKYQDEWDWIVVSNNTSLPWSLELIEEYEDRWNWIALSNNTSLPWSLELIERYENKWDWDGLSYNKALLWSLKLIEKYEGKWTWWCLSSNESLPWSTDLIERYKDKWDWSRVSRNESLPWSLELIEKYKTNWDWKELSSNNTLLWSTDLIERYKDKWDWSSLSRNKSLLWSIELIEKYKTNWNWKQLSSNYNNTIPWSIDLIEQYKDKWDFGEGIVNLSSNESLSWSIDLIEQYKDKWDFGEGIFNLSRNKSLPWSIELIKKYEDKWDCSGLSWNESLPWSQELIERYKDKWDWSSLSRNKSLPWSLELIEKYEDKWDWNKLSENPQLPWSIELIEGYKSKWDWFELQKNTTIYEKVFQPLLNDEFVNEVMSEL